MQNKKLTLLSSIEIGQTFMLRTKGIIWIKDSEYVYNPKIFKCISSNHTISKRHKAVFKVRYIHQDKYVFNNL